MSAKIMRLTPGALAYPNEEISSADRSGEGCLMQIYTSGTTSIPKGVMLSR